MQTNKSGGGKEGLIEGGINRRRERPESQIEPDIASPWATCANLIGRTSLGIAPMPAPIPIHIL